MFETQEKKLKLKKDEGLYPKYTFIDTSSLADFSGPEVARISLAILTISMDALISKHSNTFIEFLGIEVVSLVIHNLSDYLKNNQNKVALSNICLASLYTGIIGSQSGYGLCYGIAIILNLKYQCDFNMTLITILPHIMEYNLTLKSETYVKISKSLGENITEMSVLEAAIHTIETLRKMFMDLKVPKRLSEFNISEKQVLDIVEDLENSVFVQNNAREINREELEQLLHLAF